MQRKHARVRFMNSLGGCAAVSSGFVAVAAMVSDSCGSLCSALIPRVSSDSVWLPK